MPAYFIVAMASRGAHRTSNTRFPRACVRARISPAVSFHILRHSHGSMLAMRGVPMGVIAAQLGHSDTRMTEKHYAHLAPSYVAETIRAHFPTLGITKDGTVKALWRKSF
jgi:integrase